MASFADWKLRTKLFVVVILVIILLAGALTVYSIVSDVGDARRDIDSFKVEELGKRKQNLLSFVDIAYETILSEFENTQDTTYLEKRYGTQFKSIMDDAVSDAKTSAMETIKQMRYEGGVGYFWINDTTEPVPIMIMHPTVPTLDGTVLDSPNYNTVGEEKKNLFVAFNEVCKAQGEGFVRYMWPKPTADGLTEDQPKESYVRLFEPWSWIVGTGLYVDDIDVAAANKESQLRKDVSLSVLYFSLIAVSLTALSLLLLNFILRQVTKPVGEVVEWSRALSGGDLTQRLKYINKSEIGVQSKNLNSAVDSIRDLINSIKKVAATADGMRNEVAASTEETSAAFEEISANLGSVANQFNQLSKTVEDSSAAVSEITSNIASLDTIITRQMTSVTESSSAMEEMMAAINNVTNTSNEKRNATADLMSILADGKNKLASMNQVASTLGKSIDEMMEVTAIINNITSQSNMLSMNAAIEAAHAGDSGKGFSVVADEMRVLSSSTAENAKRIEATLTTNIEIIEKLLRQSTETGTAFGKIEVGVNDLADALTEISNAMVELSEGSSEVIQAVEEMRNISSEVQNGSVEMGRGNSIVTDSITKVVNISQEVGNAISEISTGTDQINIAVNSLNTRVRGMLESIAEIRTGVNKFTI